MNECHVAWCDIRDDHDHHDYPECAGKSCDPRSSIPPKRTWAFPTTNERIDEESHGQ